MSIPLRVLIIEDSEDDAELLAHELEGGGYDVTYERVDTVTAMRAALDRQPWDVIASDYTMPHFSGLAALQVFKETELDVPFIVVSGAIGEDTAVAMMKAGASDYIMKDNLARLVPALERELREANVRRERKRAEAALEESERRFRALIENASDAILVLSRDGIIRYVSPSMERIMGYRPDEILGRDPFAAIAPEIKSRASDVFRAMVQHPGMLPSMQIRVQRKDGEWRIAEGAAQNLLDDPAIGGIIVNFRDITERKRAEESLATSEERLKLALDSANDGLWDWNVPTGASYFGPRYYTMLGYEPGEFPASFESWKKLLHPEDIEGTLEKLEAHFKNRHDSYALEFRLRTKDGHWRWILSRGRVVERDLNGSAIRIVGTHTDITERKLSEEALRHYADEQATLYRTALRLNAQQELSDLLYLISEQAVALLGAEAGCVYIYHSQRDELIVSVGVGYSSEFVGITLKPGEGLSGRVFASRQSMFVEDYSTWPGRAAVHDGDPRLKATLAVPLLGGGGVLGVLNIGGGRYKSAFDEHDVRLAELFAAQAAVALENVRLHGEAQRRARELAAVNAASRTMTSVLNPEAVLKQVIDQVRRLLDAEGASVLLRNPDQTFADAELVFAAAAGPNSESLVGMRLPTTAGIAGWVMRERQSALVRDTQGDPRFDNRIDRMTSMTTRSLMAVPLSYQGTAQGVLEAINKVGGAFDEHDLEMLEALAGSAAIAIENARLYQSEREQFRRLQESQAQLVQVEKMAALGRLVASIAHEINNPLQAMQGSLELAAEELQGDHRPDKLTRYLRVANSEIERLATIVHRLRDFYRPARQGLLPTDVNAVLQSVLELAGKQLQHSHVTVEWAGADALPMIQANPDYLKQVFLNLVLNAIDAMSEHGGTLCVRTALDQMPGRASPPLPAVRTEFSDTGDGIPPEILPHIFEPFVTTKKTGTGLGLSISYGLIEAHNGRITATSQLDMGSKFTIWLPTEQC